MLPRRDHEILALRTARLFRSTFEWEEHVRFAAEAGLTDGEIEHIETGTGDLDLDSHEAALPHAADELHTDHHISAATWNVLAPHYPPGALVEIPYVVGQYAMLSMGVANAIGA